MSEDEEGRIKKEMVHILSLRSFLLLQLHQKQRLKNLERFTESETGLLIATDVAARGLDIPNIEHVVHYQVQIR